MARIWRIEVNIDEMAALLAGLETVEERGRFLDGLMVGSRGFDPNPSWPEAKVMGYHVGRKGYEIATAFSDKQSDKGKQSAEAKRLRKINHGSTTVEGWLDHGSTTDEPNINQASTNRSNDLTNTKEEPSPSAPAVSGRKKGSKQAELITGLNPLVKEAVLSLRESWPDTRDGVKFQNATGEAGVKVQAILAKHPEISLEDLMASARRYLSTNPAFPNAIQNYFGRPKPGETVSPWHRDLIVYLTEKESHV